MSQQIYVIYTFIPDLPVNAYHMAIGFPASVLRDMGGNPLNEWPPVSGLKLLFLPFPADLDDRRATVHIAKRMIELVAIFLGSEF